MGIGVYLALGSLLIILITGAIGIILALRKEPVWKDWLLGTLAGFILFFISLFIVPVPTENPQETIEPVPQETTSSAVYDEPNYNSQPFMPPDR